MLTCRFTSTCATYTNFALVLWIGICSCGSEGEGLATRLPGSGTNFCSTRDVIHHWTMKISSTTSNLRTMTWQMNSRRRLGLGRVMEWIKRETELYILSRIRARTKRTMLSLLMKERNWTKKYMIQSLAWAHLPFTQFARRQYLILSERGRWQVYCEIAIHGDMSRLIAPDISNQSQLTLLTCCEGNSAILGNVMILQFL